MNGARTWLGKVNEDGTFSIMARVTALEGTGTLVYDREGPCLTQADISAITVKVINLGSNKDATSGTEITPVLTITVSDNIYDTLQTVGWPTEKDYAGYNFRHDIGPTYAPNGSEWYLIEYRIALNGGGVVWVRVKVKSVAVQTS